MANESDEQPRIELYMYSLNQEFPVGKGHETFLKRVSELKSDISGALVQNHAVESQVFLTPGGPTDLRAKVPADWSAQWLSNQWIENHTKAAGMGQQFETQPLLGVMVREEDFGGIVFDPQSDRVYKVNHAGLSLVRALIEAKRSEKSVHSVAKATGVSTKVLDAFVLQLKAAGLWS